MGEPLQEQIKDFSIGLMDGLTVPVSVAAGLVASGKSREVILIAVIAEAIAGSVSMGLADYLSEDAVEKRKNMAWKSALRVFIGYLIGASMPLISYLYTSNTNDGFKLSILLNITAMIIFGYIRAMFLHMYPPISVGKVLLVGGISMILTYYISSMISI